MKNKYYIILLSVFLLSFAILAKSSFAISVESNRLILSDKNKTALMTIKNSSNSEKSYKIELVHYYMHGKLGTLKKISIDENIKNVNWADDFIEISPKFLTIPAGKEAEVKISVKNNAKIEENIEYRSHILVQTVPDDKKQTNFSADAVVGMINPVFIRYGSFNADVDIKNITLTNIDAGKYKLKFNITREGNKSIYGKIKISCLTGKEKVIIKEIYGLAVYKELTNKEVSLNFADTDEHKNKCEKIELAYISTIKYNSPNKIWARKEVNF